MHDKGYVRVATVTPIIKVAHCEHNKDQIIQTLKEVIAEDVEVVVYPELCISGYTCGDLFYQDTLLKEVESSIADVCDFLSPHAILAVVGGPVRLRGAIYNCAIVINGGKIMAIIPKKHLPNSTESFEKRWFSSGFNLEGNESIRYCGQDVPFGCDVLFQHEDLPSFILGVEIGQDLWATIPPSSYYSQAGAVLIVNPSASSEVVGKSLYRKKLIEQQSSRCVLAYASVSSGFGESTTDLVFGGHGLIYENGTLLKESERFSYQANISIADIDLDKINYDRLQLTPLREAGENQERGYEFIAFRTKDADHSLARHVDAHPFIPSDEEERSGACKEIFSIQTMALAKRLSHIGYPTMVIGISGGLDSTLALMVCVETCKQLNLGRKNILAVTMPGFGTTDRTYNNAMVLMEKLGVSIREISIKESCIQHFKDIGHNLNKRDVTYENAQARERTQVLMDLANKEGGIVIGTGDLSESALGWSTYNGDHMSMYAVNSGVPKTFVRHLVKWIADRSEDSGVRDILYDVLSTPVSPELLPPDESGKIAQKTENLVGPYELHDFFLYNVVRCGYSPKKVYYLGKVAFEGQYNDEVILKWLKSFYRRFFSQQFKRSSMPDGPKVGSVNLSPRGDWKMPSDASNYIWMKELERL